MKTLKFIAFPILLSFLLVLVSAKTDGSKETERIHKASNVLKEFGKMKESIPHQLLEDCSGIVVIPGMLNAGLVAGGKRGRGVAMVKLDNGKWSDPFLLTLTGGSFGLQIRCSICRPGFWFFSVIRACSPKVKNGDFTIGGDISAAAGPYGRNSTASTDYKFEAEVYSYSHSSGLFAGVSINGSNLGIDKEADAEYYGSAISSHEIFETSKSNTEAVALLKETVGALLKKFNTDHKKPPEQIAGALKKFSFN